MNDQLMEMLDTLFATFSPLPGVTSPEGFKTAMRAYGMALNGFELRDIEAGITMILNGGFPEHSGTYAPTAPQLARATRKALDNRLDAERRSKPALALPAPEFDKGLPENARGDFVRAKLAEAGYGAPDLRTPDVIAAEKRERYRLDREDQIMGADQDPEAMRKRLLGHAIGNNREDPAP